MEDDDDFPAEPDRVRRRVTSKTPSEPNTARSSVDVDSFISALRRPPNEEDLRIVSMVLRGVDVTEDFSPEGVTEACQKM